MINGGELAALYCFGFLLIAANGPGIWSIDNFSPKKMAKKILRRKEHGIHHSTRFAGAWGLTVLNCLEISSSNLPAK